MKPPKEKKPAGAKAPEAPPEAEDAPEPELLTEKPRKGRPPGSKTKPKTTVRVPIARLLKVPVYLDKDGKLLSPKDPGLLLKQDPMRDTVQHVAPLLPLDGLSWAVARSKGGKKRGRKTLRTYYPTPGLVLIQECFDALVESLGPDIHPGWALLICYALTLTAGIVAYNLDSPDEKEEAHGGTVERLAGRRADSEEAAGRSADDSGGGEAGDGQDDAAPFIRREDRAPPAGA